MQTLPSALNDLLSLAEHVASGLEMHGPWLGMTQIPLSEFRRVLDETKQAEFRWSAADNARVYSEGRMAKADDDIMAWLAKARLAVMLARGERWSPQWIETGFIHRAGIVPKRIEARILLARRLVNFLSLHPEYGVSFAGVTAARGRSIYERAIQARAALDLATTDSVLKKRLRNAAKRVLRSAIYQVTRALDSAIAPNDARWLEFGLSPSTRRPARKGNVRHRHLTEVPTEPEPIPLLTETHSDPERTAAACLVRGCA